MLRDFFNVAATPPVQEGQWRSSQFIHTLIDRAYKENFAVLNLDLIWESAAQQSFAISRLED
jgi:hypothetical protein